MKSVRELHRNSYTAIKQGGPLSKGFEVTKGLRQECLISPTLFKVYVEKDLNIWKRKYSGMGYNVDNRTVHTAQFAGGQVVVAQSKEDMECVCVCVCVPEAATKIF